MEKAGVQGLGGIVDDWAEVGGQLDFHPLHCFGFHVPALARIPNRGQETCGPKSSLCGWSQVGVKASPERRRRTCAMRRSYTAHGAVIAVPALQARNDVGSSDLPDMDRSSLHRRVDSNGTHSQLPKNDTATRIATILPRRNLWRQSARRNVLSTANTVCSTHPS